MPKIKQSNKGFLRYFQKSHFYAQNELKRGPGAEVGFFVFFNLALSLLSTYDD